MSQWHGGKGDAPRKQQDKKAYDDGWDRIFGRNKVTGKKPKRNTYDEIVEGFESMKPIDKPQDECND